MQKNNKYSYIKSVRPVSVDGFVPTSKRPINRVQKRTGSAPGSIKSIDSFSKSLDGFKSSSQSVIGYSHSINRSADISMPVSKSIDDRVKSTYKSKNDNKKQLERYKKRIEERNHKPQGSKLSWLRWKNRHSRTRTQKIALRTSAVFGSMLLILGGGLTLRALMLSRSIFKGGGSSALLNSQDIDPSMLRGEGDGRINILVLGKGGPEQSDGPDLTDTIIVASLDPIADEAALLSVPRDFWVKSPSGGQSKINQVYFDSKNKVLNSYSIGERSSGDARERSEAAGVDAMKKVISETMGVPIHYHAMIDFAGFKKAIDTVGGIDINVTEDMAVTETMYINGRYLLDVGPGQQYFDGQKALAFSRSRKTSTRGDFARSDRQRAVMIGLKDKVVSSGTLANPVKINQLMSDFDGQLGTDFSVNEMLRLYDLGKEIPSNKISSINLQDYVGGDMINGLSVQVPKAGLFDYSQIHSYIRNTMRDSFLKKEDAKILILNGTETAGLATKKSDELKSYGYNVASVGDAPTKNYQNTVLVDLRSGINKYTKNYLEKRLKQASVGSVPDPNISASDADFVIILGNNETSR